MAIITYPYVGTEILQEDQPYYNMVESTENGVDFTVSEDATATMEASFFQNTHYPLESDNVSWISVAADWTRGTTTGTEFVAKWSLYGLDDHGEEELIGVQQTTVCASPTSGLETILFDLKGSGGVAPVQKISGSAPDGKVQMNLPMPYENYYNIAMDSHWFDSAWGQRATMSVHGGTRTNYKEPTFDFILPWQTGMAADFSDVRFTEADGITGCCYWIKRKEDTNYAWITLKLKQTIKNRENKFYLYYANAAATPVSSIAGVSEFYDEFDGTDVDATKWEGYEYGTGSISVTAGKLTINGGTGSSSRTTLVTADPLLFDGEGYGYIIESYAQCTTIGVSPVGAGTWTGIQDDQTSISLVNNYQETVNLYSATTPGAMLQNSKSGGVAGTYSLLVTPSDVNRYKMVRHTVMYTTPYRHRFTAWDGEPYGANMRGYMYEYDEPVASTVDNYYVSLAARNAIMEYDWISVRKFCGDELYVSVGDTISYSDYFDDNAITFGYTATPVSPTTGITLTETGTTSRLKLEIATGTDNQLTATTHREAAVYNLAPYSDWDYTVKISDITVSPGCQAGIFIGSNWDNLQMFYYGKTSGGTRHLGLRSIENNVADTIATDSGVTATPVWLRIDRKWGYTRFKYSLDKLSWTTFNYGADLGFYTSTPLYVGLYGTNDSNKYKYTVYFDDLELNVPLSDIRSSVISTTPDTAADEDQTIYFTTPAQWIDTNSVYFDIEEYNMDSYQTPPQPLNAKNIVNLKYDNTDKYWAMRLKYEAEHTDEVEVNIGKITYTYEV